MMILTLGAAHLLDFDVGLNIFLGLFLFGIGMVLAAGACTVSTWVKAAEGNIGAVWALLFTFVGMFLFSLLWSYNLWPPAPDACRPGTSLTAKGGLRPGGKSCGFFLLCISPAARACWWRGSCIWRAETGLCRDASSARTNGK